MSFNSLTDGPAPSNALTTTRLKRQLVEQAIAAATAADWEEAARLNERLLELGADSEAENRLAKAYWEQGELANAGSTTRPRSRSTPPTASRSGTSTASGRSSPRPARRPWPPSPAARRP